MRRRNIVIGMVIFVVMYSLSIMRISFVAVNNKNNDDKPQSIPFGSYKGEKGEVDHHRASVGIVAANWKDEWIEQWISKQKQFPFPSSCDGHCIIPKYIKPREPNDSPQTIPRTMWFSWKTVNLTTSFWEAANSWVTRNPEYEFFLFENDDVFDFMCSKASEQIREAFTLMYPMASKIDIWRVFLLYQYGGFYADFDTFCAEPLRNEIPWDASLVTGLSDEGFHQYTMTYRARHPILQQTLIQIYKNVKKFHAEGKKVPVVHVTGPDPFMDAVRRVLDANNCIKPEFNKPSNYKVGNTHLNDLPQNCSETTPFNIGKMQIVPWRQKAVTVKYRKIAASFHDYDKQPLFHKPETYKKAACDNIYAMQEAKNH